MMTNEEAKCIADGIAEQALNAIEKKLNGMGEDFSEVKELTGLGKPIVISCDAVEASRNFDPYPPLDQDEVEKTFKIVYPEGADDNEKWVLYYIVLEHSGLLTMENVVKYATDPDSELLRRATACEVCDVLCHAWGNDMPDGTFMDHRPHVKVDYQEYVKGNGGKIIVEFSTEFLH